MLVGIKILLRRNSYLRSENTIVMEYGETARAATE